jgi:hypothetical protein
VNAACLGGPTFTCCCSHKTCTHVAVHITQARLSPAGCSVVLLADSCLPRAWIWDHCGVVS